MSNISRGPRLRGTARVKMAKRVTRLYQAGKDLRTIAARCGISYTLARTLVLESSVTLRPRGGWGVSRGATR